MKPRQSRWMKWVVLEAARETTPMPFARGKRRAQTIARRALAPVTSRQAAPIGADASA